MAAFVLRLLWGGRLPRPTPLRMHTRWLQVSLALIRLALRSRSLARVLAKQVIAVVPLPVRRLRLRGLRGIWASGGLLHRSSTATTISARMISPQTGQAPRRSARGQAAAVAEARVAPPSRSSSRKLSCARRSWPFLGGWAVRSSPAVQTLPSVAHRCRWVRLRTMLRHTSASFRQRSVGGPLLSLLRLRGLPVWMKRGRVAQRGQRAQMAVPACLHTLKTRSMLSCAPHGCICRRARNTALAKKRFVEALHAQPKAPQVCAIVLLCQRFPLCAACIALEAVAACVAGVPTLLALGAAGGRARAQVWIEYAKFEEERGHTERCQVGPVHHSSCCVPLHACNHSEGAGTAKHMQRVHTYSPSLRDFSLYLVCDARRAS